MAFVAVLSWSRRIFLRFSLDSRMVSFLRGHVQAFQAWGGLPRVLLYDNLKSAVLERQGDAIRYIRDNFWPARTFTNLDDLNAQADAWVNGPADERLCPQDKTLTVGQAFVQVQPHLLTLPTNLYPVEERVVVTVGKTPYVRFDLNDYSVPHTQVRKALTVLADTKTVRILDGQVVVASHARSYDKGQQIEIESHIKDLVERKAQAHVQRGMGRLSQAVPAQAATKGENLGTITSALLRLADRYGATEVQTAVLTALARKVPHPNAVRLALEAQREARQAPAPVAVQLSEKARLRDTVIHAQPLASYDQLSGTPAAAQDSVPDGTPLTTITPPHAKRNQTPPSTKSQFKAKRSERDESKK